jgi:hypothetical protein
LGAFKVSNSFGEGLIEMTHCQETQQKTQKSFGMHYYEQQYTRKLLYKPVQKMVIKES